MKQGRCSEGRAREGGTSRSEQDDAAPDRHTGDRLLQQVSRCVKCGSCRTVCPSFRATLQESFSPRGRMALVRAVLEGRLPSSDLFSDRLDTCLSCLACEEVCASSVPVTGIIQAAREEHIRKAGPGIIKAFLGGMLKNRAAMAASAWLAPLALHYGLSSFAPAAKQRRGRGAAKRMPAGSYDLVLFPGCSLTYHQQGLLEAAVAVLTAMGHGVTVPEGLRCCGRPLLSLGDRKGPAEAAEHNRALLASLGSVPVVTACASCSLTLKKEYPALLRPGREMPPVLDVHEVLASGIGRLQFRHRPGTVTWHDPCHLGRGQHLSSLARDVIRAVPGATLREMRDADRCCGFGGVMRVTHHGLSDSILAEKTRNIIAVAPDLVVTGCPSCRTQLSEGLRRAGREIRAVHTVELVALAMESDDGAHDHESGNSQRGGQERKVP